MPSVTTVINEYPKLFFTVTSANPFEPKESHTGVFTRLGLWMIPQKNELTVCPCTSEPGCARVATLVV